MREGPCQHVLAWPQDVALGLAAKAERGFWDCYVQGQDFLVVTVISLELSAVVGRPHCHGLQAEVPFGIADVTGVDGSRPIYATKVIAERYTWGAF